ncbi:NAD(P)H-dependent oxidoreductase [Burkholderia pyrrocinia]|uniref:NAD(P)H-dependent oxidoreductase n=1 Tax=Burkholderia pyrrocinia TaxID=60550 RepID=UPI001EE7195B|nr:NAD(P)H-dependent oxidoreductase [Burkholderia pyrrocinia]
MLVICGHPDLESSRVNRAVVSALRTDNAITLHILAENFANHQFDVAAEQDRLTHHNRIVLLFPMYWYSCPALMKQWIDDVFTPGFAYARNGDKLRDKEFLVVTTIGAPESAYRASGFNNHTVDELLRPLQQTVCYIRARYLGAFSAYESVFIDDVALVEAVDKIMVEIKRSYDTSARAYEELLCKAESAGISLIQ